MPRLRVTGGSRRLLTGEGMPSNECEPTPGVQNSAPRDESLQYRLDDIAKSAFAAQGRTRTILRFRSSSIGLAPSQVGAEENLTMPQFINDNAATMALDGLQSGPRVLLAMASCCLVCFSAENARPRPISGKFRARSAFPRWSLIRSRRQPAARTPELLEHNNP